MSPLKINSKHDNSNSGTFISKLYISLLFKQTNLFSSYITPSVFSIFFLVFYEHIRYNKGKIRYVVCVKLNTQKFQLNLKVIQMEWMKWISQIKPLSKK